MKAIGISNGAMNAALVSCRRHFVSAVAFSALINLLYIVPTLYMLQVYDRVVPTRGELTLLFLTLVLLFALITLALLDRIRTRLLVRAALQLDATLAPAVVDTALMRANAPFARHALRDFDLMRTALTGPGMLALLDAPWTPIYFLICFLVHPAVGLITLIGILVLPAIAWRNEKATHDQFAAAQIAANEAYNRQEVFL